MKKIFFIIPFFKKSITGGTSYDINLGKSLKEDFIYQKNIHCQRILYLKI